MITEDTLMEYIPDLEEVQEEDLTMAVASAPEYVQFDCTSNLVMGWLTF